MSQNTVSDQILECLDQVDSAPTERDRQVARARLRVLHDKQRPLRVTVDASGVTL